MKFSEITGQENVKRLLIYSAKAKRIPHALLFDGPEGTGKLPLAIAYARYINCENPSDTDSCDSCPSCNKYKKLIHPDLHFVFPIIKGTLSKAVCDDFIKEWREFVLDCAYFTPVQWYSFIGKEKGQGVIYSEEAGEIIRKLNLKTYEAEYKCMIVWLPEKFHPVTANKLLKILEEPPDNTVFILISENTDDVLQTLLSRCQLIKIPSIDDVSLYNSLKEMYSNPEHEIRNAAMLADGNFIKARSVIENSEENQVFLNHFMSLMRNAYQKKISELITWSEEISRISLEKQKEFLLYTLRIIRDNFFINVGLSNRIMQSENEKGFSDKFHPFINTNNVFSLEENIRKAYFHLERNGKPKLIFMDLSFSVMSVIKS